MALCLSTVDDKETKIERQTSERVLLVKNVGKRWRAERYDAKNINIYAVKFHSLM